MASSAGKRAGQQFGNYRLLHLLAQDPFAEVYLGEHIFLKTQAAIKVVQVGLTNEELERFLAEVRVMARLKHPHIIRVLEFGVQAEQPFLVMDYASNDSLRQLHPQGSPLPLATIRDYVRQIAPVLQCAHDEGLLHRNLRPETILLGPHKQLLLSDFGTSVLDQSAIPTHPLPAPDQGEAEIVSYRAPEQLQGEPCAASDQYALAAMVYEWLGGQPSSPAVQQVVLKALATDPEFRFATVSDFAYALEEALRPTLEPIQLAPEKPGQRPAPSVPMMVTLIALVAVVVGSSTLLFSRALFSSSGPSFQVAATSTARAKLATVDATFTPLTPQEIYLHVTGAQPIINDPLHQQTGSKWDDGHFAGGSCTFSGGAYHVVSDAGQQGWGCLSRSSNLRNFAFQVQMTIVKGDYGGIFFRVGRSGIPSYTFLLDDTDGSYRFSVVDTSPSLLLAVGNLPVIKTVLNRPCLMTVIAVGSRFYLYLNKQYITDVTDSSNTLTSGQIGLMAGSKTEAVFRNVEVWKL
ncbi:MAG: serine/threonine protein kinase [Chloroflexi bacterium]|nr:serine/threonine protein kinase [Chloroflexota bacterium]